VNDQYFGDEKDYIKYGLLRCLVSSGLEVGICWMLTPDDSGPDGRKTQYLLDPQAWRLHDPQLFDALADAVFLRAERRVSLLESMRLIEPSRFHNELVPDSFQARQRWFARALAALRGSDVIFFDPDNGLEVPSRHMGRKDSSKYLAWDEVAETWEAGCSVLIFQHFTRENREIFTRRLVEAVHDFTGGGKVFALRSPSVLYLFACQKAHSVQVEHFLQALEDSWCPKVWLAEELPIEMLD
jgi:hypothetical protein